MSIAASSENVAKLLLRRRVANLLPGELADALDTLVWVMDDNGAEIDVARREWIEGDDPYAAEVAIAMDEGLPFEPAIMLKKLRELEERWPHLRARCAVIRERLRTFGPGFEDP